MSALYKTRERDVFSLGDENNPSFFNPSLTFPPASAFLGTTVELQQEDSKGAKTDEKLRGRVGSG